MLNIKIENVISTINETYDACVLSQEQKNKIKISAKKCEKVTTNDYILNTKESSNKHE